ncbi:MAG TPA: 1-acyl-sn-glycerol-3-phosphate acyltransferase [Candidatus Angelobacter sp.]
MARVAIVESKPNAWASEVLRAVSARQKNEYHLVSPLEIVRQSDGKPETICIYVPPFADQEGTTPDLQDAEAVFQQLAELQSGAVVLISSALIYGIGPGRQAFAKEDYSPPGNGGKRICDQWDSLEGTARKSLSRNVRLTVLRAATVLPSPTVFSRWLSHGLVRTMPGHDPCLQFLSLNDLAQAVDCAIEQRESGIFNVAPDTAVPLHAAIRMADAHRVAIPRTLQRLTKRSEVLDHFRYSWTVSNEKAREELGFVARTSSLATLAEFRGRHLSSDLTFDDFGMDREYIRFYGRTLFRFLSDFYWRIEDRGLQHVPQEGRAVLVGMHRGFMPWDGVMALHLLVKKTGRYPRFLTHPALLKFPFLANFMTKLGGVVATQQSADRVLQANELLGIFPEGIHGAFTSYKHAYQLQEFGRDAFVKIALRNRAPIVPFVTVGSAEIFPILAKIKSRFWTRYTEWPCVPLTPTFPLLPIPLPSKWHTQFLPPIHIEKDYPPAAERNRSVVKAISLEVRTRMQQAVNEMLERRRSIFFGSIFEAEAS